MKTFVLTATLCLALSGPSLAQETGSVDRSDRSVASDVRLLRRHVTADLPSGPKPGHRRHPVRPASAISGTGQAATSPDAPRPNPSDAHPTDFSVAVHGGGNVQQHYTVSSGSSAPGEETGDSVAAGFKVGF